MTTRTPIEFADIRVGDTVERVWRGIAYRITVARRIYGAAYSTEGTCFIDQPSAAWFLLDRPAPAVVLPTENTLGIVTFRNGETHMGVWRVRGQGALTGALTDIDYTSDCWEPTRVTAFEPATAVKTSALDALRGALMRSRDTADLGKAGAIRTIAMGDFLAAVEGGQS